MSARWLRLATSLEVFSDNSFFFYYQRPPVAPAGSVRGSRAPEHMSEGFFVFLDKTLEQKP